MLCDRCKQNAATRHITKTVCEASATRHYCDPCFNDLGLSEIPNDFLLLFPWDEKGGESFSVVGVVSRVEPEVVALRVATSSHYLPDSEILIRAKYVPPGLQHAGIKFGFCFPAEGISNILVGVEHQLQMSQMSAHDAKRDDGRPTTSTRISGERLTEEYPTNGIAHIRLFVDRMQTASKNRTSLIISTLDDQKAILLVRDHGRTFLSISAVTSRKDAFESRIMDFFGNLMMLPVRDRVTAYNTVPASLRTWHYEMPEDVNATVLLCVSIFRQLFDIKEAAGLRFSARGL